MLDDSGVDGQPKITRFPFETPLNEEEIATAPEFKAPRSGGMYVAKLPQLTAAIIVPPVVQGLEDLGITPTIDLESRSLEAVIRTLAISHLWQRAKLPGEFFSAMRRRDVLLALGDHAMRLLCGDKWARAELAARKRKNGITQLKCAVSRRRDEVAVAIILEKESVDLATKTCRERVASLASFGTRYNLLPTTGPAGETDARWLSELALRIASDVGGVETWAGERLRSGVTQLMELTTFAKGARFLVLSIDSHRLSKARPTELYAGWEWE
ncbi:MAG TPA: hypothetical protein VMM38_09515 [Aridibacter sp.]|nr:hypothetical protein [Aridibacter sp.]